MESAITGIHPNFKLNGISFSKENLLEVGYCLIKEGVDYEKTIGEFLLDWLSAKDSVKAFTSGSSGTPKTIELKKRHMVNSALATGSFFNLKPGDKALHCLPTTFIAGKMMLIRAMLLGLELDYVEPTSKPMLEVNKLYDFVAMIPLQLQNSINKLSLVKTLIVGGAPFPVKLQKEVFNTQTSIFETYGMTETITHIAVRKIEFKFEGSFFEALPDIKLSVDERSCLIIDAPKICSTPVITNDVVNLISNTRFQWLGRFDNVINSGSIKLYPEKIEEKLAGVIEDNFFVTSVEDAVLGEKLILVIEGKENKLLIASLKENDILKKYEIPKEIYFVPEFSFTKNGKIQRKETLDNLKIKSN